MSGSLRLPVEQPITSASRGVSWAGETTAIVYADQTPDDNAPTARPQRRKPGEQRNSFMSSSTVTRGHGRQASANP